MKPISNRVRCRKGMWVALHLFLLSFSKGGVSFSKFKSKASFLLQITCDNNVHIGTMNHHSSSIHFFHYFRGNRRNKPILLLNQHNPLKWKHVEWLALGTLNEMLWYLVACFVAGNQYISTKEMDNNILRIFTQKVVTWVASIHFPPHERIKFGFWWKQVLSWYTHTNF